MSVSKPATPPIPTTLDLALTFARISLLGFGGALPWAHRALVERQKWMTSAQFADNLALCQFLPGPSIVNLAIIVSSRYHGALGATAGVAGLIVPPAIVVLLVGIVYNIVAGNVLVRGALAGIAAAAAGLLAATAFRMVMVLLKSRTREPLAFAAVAFAAIAVARFSLPLTLLVLAPLSIAFAWRHAK